MLDPNLLLDGERRLRRSDGTELWVVQSHEVVRHNNGEPQFVVLSLVDVTDRRRAEDDLVRRAFTDPLTGLPNRRALTDRLRHAVALSRRRGLQVGLVHLNIDRFKAVNEALGHEAGDLLLSQVADRLRWSTRVEDTAVRLGADEFLVVAEDVEDLDGLRALADRLLSVLDEPFVVHEREINLSASVGLTLGSDMTPDDLLRQAQSALTKAKADGSRARIEVHEGVLSHDDVDALQLETDLRHALDNEELRLFYQPIVHLGDETLLGYEALVRWQHPTRGLLPPAAFLDAAENNRLTSKLGAWVLHRACTDAATWPEDLRVHVNISARHLAEDGFSELVADALAESGLAPGPARAGDHRVDGAVRRRGDAALGRRRHRRRRHPGPRRLRHRLLRDHGAAPAADPHGQDRPVVRRRRRHRAGHGRPRPGSAAARPRHGPAGDRRGHRGPRPGRLAARPRLRDGPGLRVRPPAPLPSPAEVFIGELIDAPAESRRRADGRPMLATRCRPAAVDDEPAPRDYDTGRPTTSRPVRRPPASCSTSSPTPTRSKDPLPPPLASSGQDPDGATARLTSGDATMRACASTSPPP